jgi:hypothetical protein
MRAAVLMSTSSASARDATVPCLVRTGWNGGAGSISGPVNGMAFTGLEGNLVSIQGWQDLP